MELGKGEIGKLGRSNLEDLYDIEEGLADGKSIDQKNQNRRIKMALSIAEVEQLIQKNSFSDEESRIIEIILAAINDWPNPNLTLEDYELAVSEFIGGKSNKNNIEKSLEKIDLNKYAWQAESLAVLREVFKFYGNQDLSLKEIISRLIYK